MPKSELAWNPVLDLCEDEKGNIRAEAFEAISEMTYDQIVRLICHQNARIKRRLEKQEFDSK